ncbi:MAG TPA: hydroxylamine reductase, partial [Bacillota bacterium]|nr:hydroxylamine reductase [Bacillota bacterium]
MFCNQCEQTAKGVACTVKGVCGKTADLADLQDLVMHAVRGISHFAVAGRKVGIVDPELNRFTCKAVFSTLTNVNFDEARFQEIIRQCVEHRERIKAKVTEKGGQTQFDDPATTFQPASTVTDLIKQGQT